MSKRNLYLIIFILVAVIGYLFFRQNQPGEQTLPETSTTTSVGSTSSVPLEDAVTPVATTTKTTETVTIDGLFLGLTEEENEYNKSFFYLLLDDGTEVVRIDLRPLLGYSLIDPISKLGVDRGQRVRLTGTMEDKKFVVGQITPLTE